MSAEQAADFGSGGAGVGGKPELKSAKLKPMKHKGKHPQKRKVQGTTNRKG